MMTDTPTPQQEIPLGPRTRVAAAAIAATFAMSMAVYLVMKGSPTNTLHESALSWSFLIIMAILIGFGFSAIKDLILWFKPKA